MLSGPARVTARSLTSSAVRAAGARSKHTLPKLPYSYDAVSNLEAALTDPRRTASVERMQA